jgi:hypothetical protein
LCALQDLRGRLCEDPGADVTAARLLEEDLPYAGVQHLDRDRVERLLEDRLASNLLRLKTRSPSMAVPSFVEAAAGASEAEKPTLALEAPASIDTCQAV